MSTVLQHKRSSSTGVSPTTGQIAFGELAINTYDGTLFLKKDDGGGEVIVTLREVTEDNLAVDTSGFTNSNASFLAGALTDLDGAIAAAVSGGLTAVTTDSTLTGNGTSGSPLSVNIGLDDLTDVDTATSPPTSGQVLKWNGTKWIPANDVDTQLSLASASIDDLGDVDLTTVAPTVGQYLKWDGLNWIPGTVSSGGAGGVPYAEQTVISDSFTGNGSNTDFETSIIPDSEDHVLVSLNGIVQDPSIYSLDGTTITFATAPANGDNVELRTFSGFSTSVAFNNYHAYQFTIGTNTTTISGNDDNGDTLSYTAGRVEVYVNGVRLSNGLDYTATNGSTITISETVFAGSVVEVVSLASAALLNQALEIQTESIALTTTDADQPVASFPSADYRTAKFLVQMTHASAGYHATEVLLIHNGTTVFTTEYATIFTGSSLGTVDAQISSGNVQLLVTPANTNTTVKTKRISVEA
jgi:hypothetical protein